MRLLLFLFFLIMQIEAFPAKIDSNSTHYYMYIYFVDGEQEVHMGARLALSNDGTNWVKYNNEQPIIKPHPSISIGEQPMIRDPNIFYDTTTGVFHLIWTTGWNQKIIGYATSKNLISWSDQVLIPVGNRILNCRYCRAPEFFYDDLRDSVMIVWTSSISTNASEIFYSMTKDFKHYTAPQSLFSPKNEYEERYSVTDPTILKVADKKYYLFFKDDRKESGTGLQYKNIHFVVGPTPQGPWVTGPTDEVSEPISGFENEGPSPIIIGEEIRVYYHPYNNTKNAERLVKIKLTDLVSTGLYPDKNSWSNGGILINGSADFLPAHGSIIEIPRAKALQVVYAIEDKTQYSKVWTALNQGEIEVERPVLGIFAPPVSELKNQISISFLNDNKILLKYSFPKHTIVSVSVYSLDGRLVTRKMIATNIKTEVINLQRQGYKCGLDSFVVSVNIGENKTINQIIIPHVTHKKF